MFPKFMLLLICLTVPMDCLIRWVYRAKPYTSTVYDDKQPTCHVVTAGLSRCTTGRAAKTGRSSVIRTDPISTDREPRLDLLTILLEPRKGKTVTTTMYTKTLDVSTIEHINCVEEGEDILPLCEGSTSPQCPALFTLYGTSCYYFGTQDFVWADSRAECQALGADLAILDSAEELEALQDGPGEGESYHIGLRRVSGDFQWIDGSPLGYTNWKDFNHPRDSPNDYAQIDFGDEKKWGTFEDDSDVRSLCEVAPM